MNRARIGWSLAALVMLVWAVQPRCAWACSCIPPGSPTQERDRSTAVFAGRVTDVSTPASNVAITVAVHEVWKGDVGSSVEITTPRDSAACGYQFVAGEEYVIYASESEGQLETTLCSRTQPLADAADDLAALGDGQAPTGSTAETPQPSVLPNTSGEIEPPALDLLALVAVGGLGVLAVSVAGYMWRKHTW